MSRNAIELKRIFFPSKERLRQEYGDVKGLAESMARVGQLQSVLIRLPFENEDVKGKDFVLVEGGRRVLAILLCREQDVVIRNVRPGTILAEVEDDVDDPLFALEMEFHANEKRKDFSWKEQMNYVHRIHTRHKERDDSWTAEHSCALLQMGKTTLYRYLELAKSGEILEHPDVESADSFRTAYKQYQRIKKIRQRQAVVEHRAKTTPSKDGGHLPEVSLVDDPGGLDDEESFVPPSEYSKAICQLADCRDWIKLWQDESFDYIHWDPPYGGEQSGGAFSAHPDIDDSPEYAFSLLGEVLPEIFRTLRDGHWLALWFHPSYYKEIYELLKQNGFWVNPYPNIWYKVDRKADGHEIKRFLTNAYETFFFAAKADEDDDAILLRNDRQNVFTFKMVERAERTHIMEKPPSLLGEILSCISLKHEFGADLGVGSGSIYEAACFNARRIAGCEIDETYSIIAQERASEALIESGVSFFDFEYALSESEDSDHIRKLIPGYEMGLANLK